MANIARMTKKQLVAHGKKLGVDLSMDSTRKTMIAEIRGFKKPTNQTVKKKAAITKAKQVSQPQKKSFVRRIMEWWGL